MRQLWTSTILLGTLVALIGVCGCGGAGAIGPAVDRADQDVAGAVGPQGLIPGFTPDRADTAAVVAACTQDLARRLGAVPEAGGIELVRTEAVTWPSAALGCPRPGCSYIQVLTPGYRVFLAANGQTHEYHTDTCRRVVYYPSLPVAHCRSDLASRLDVPAEQLSLVGIEEVTWPDAALGCPMPGMDYAQEPVPGFRIVLGPGGLHEYHTDMGSHCVYCPLDHEA